MTLGTLLLAAGGSTRLGSPKQLLEYEGKSLLRRAAESARAAVGGPVVVILGSGAGRIKRELNGLDVHPVTNPSWAHGMGTGVRLGIKTLEELAPGRVDAVLLMLCDQPLVGPEALARLQKAFRQSALSGALAAAAYNGTVGVPAVFGRAYFDEMSHLPDDAGAKQILRRHRPSVTEVPMPEAATDIDTREQYEHLASTGTKP